MYDTMGVVVDSVFRKWKEHDCCRLIKDLDPNYYDYTGIFFACGINDFLYKYPSHTCFADTLDELGIDYQFLITNDSNTLSDEMLTAGMHFLDSVMYDTIFVGDISLTAEKTIKFTSYPNPFTTTTTLTYTLSKPSKVTIRIFNTQGQLVDMIEQEQPKGPQQIQWDADGLPAGMYYFRVQAGDMVGGGKTVLTR
jgi:hypothetical protein